MVIETYQDKKFESPIAEDNMDHVRLQPRAAAKHQPSFCYRTGKYPPEKRGEVVQWTHALPREGGQLQKKEASTKEGRVQILPASDGVNTWGEEAVGSEAGEGGWGMKRRLE